MSDQPRKKKEYEEKVKKELMKDLKIDNVMAVPTIIKITINSGMGDAKEDAKIFEEMVRDMSLIAGQKPLITKTQKAISNFKIKPGSQVGMFVTLRGRKMWEFFDKLISITLPRVKDFRGLSPKAFDGRGNYSLGLREHTVFVEVDSNKVTRLRGLQITISTSAKNDDHAKELLKKLGMPFMKSAKKETNLDEELSTIHKRDHSGDEKLEEAEVAAE